MLLAIFEKHREYLKEDSYLQIPSILCYNELFHFIMNAILLQTVKMKFYSTMRLFLFLRKYPTIEEKRGVYL